TARTPARCGRIRAPAAPRPYAAAGRPVRSAPQSSACAAGVSSPSSPRSLAPHSKDGLRTGSPSSCSVDSYHRGVWFGRFEVHLFSAGVFKQDGGLMFGVVPKVVWERALKPDDRNRVTVPMNCLLVRDDRNVVLLETGAGDKLEAKWLDVWGIDPREHVLHKLKDRGIDADEVTIVLNTHLHFDHAGGNTVRGERGRPQ